MDFLFFQNWPVSSLLILGVVLCLVVCLIKIRQLNVTMEDETRRRMCPLLYLDIRDNPPGLYLFNDSYCYATDITIDDCHVILDYGFKKSLNLKFEPIPFLKPGQRVRLHFQVYDGIYHLGPEFTDQLSEQIKNASFVMCLRFANIEKIPFAATIQKNKEKIIVQNAVPMANGKPNPLFKVFSLHKNL